MSLLALHDSAPSQADIEPLLSVIEHGAILVRTVNKLPDHMAPPRHVSGIAERLCALLSRICELPVEKRANLVHQTTLERLGALPSKFGVVCDAILESLVVRSEDSRARRHALFQSWITQYELQERIQSLTPALEDVSQRLNRDLAIANPEPGAYYASVAVPPYRATPEPEPDPPPPADLSHFSLSRGELDFLLDTLNYIISEYDLPDPPSELPPLFAEIDAQESVDETIIFKLYDLLCLYYHPSSTPTDLLEIVDYFDEDFRLDPPAPIFDPPDPSVLFHLVNALQRCAKLPNKVNAWILALCAAELCRWEAYPEAEAVGTWAETLYKAIRRGAEHGSLFPPNTRRRLDYNLALSFLNSARFKYMNGHSDIIHKINEGIYYLQHIPDAANIPKVQWTLARAMRFLAMLTGAPEEGFVRVREAIDKYGNILSEIEGWKMAMVHATNEARASNHPLLKSGLALPPYPPISPNASTTKLRGLDRVEFHFASALYTMCSSYHTVEKWQEAIDAQKGAVDQFKYVYENAPLTLALEALAHGYAYLSQSSFPDTTDVTPEEQFAWAKEAVVAYRELMKRSKVYAHAFRTALTTHADQLETRGDFTGASEALIEMTEVIKEHLTDTFSLGHAYDRIAWFYRLLKRYYDGLKYDRLAIQVYRQEYREMSKAEADSSHNYAFDLAALDRTQEALHVEEEVYYYHKMAVETDETARKSVADALTALATYHFQLSNQRQGMDLATEALVEYERVCADGGGVSEDPDEGSPIEDYLYCISITINNAISHKVDEERAVWVGEFCLEKVRQLLALHPKHEQVLESYLEVQLSHGMILSRQRKTEESIKWWKRLLVEYDERFDLNTAKGFVHVNYLETLLNLEDDLYDVGQLRQAKEVLLKVREEGMKFIDQHPTLHVSVVYASFNHAQLLIDFEADCEGALAVTGATLSLIRDHPQTDHTSRAGSIVFVAHCISLMTRARALSRMGRHLDALGVIQEAIELVARTPVKEVAKGWKFGPLCLPRNLAERGVILADIGREEEAFEVSKEAWEVLCKMKRTYTFQKSDVEVVEGECLQYLAEKYALRGEVGEAARLFEDVVENYRESALTRPEMRSELALALRTVGMMYCSLGRHAEGVAARKEYEELRKSLRENLPDLDQSVEVGVKFDGIRPARVEMTRRLGLKCGHHE